MPLRYRLGSFGRAVATVAGGTAAGQAVLIAASPVVTRIYTTADFGTLAMYMAVVGIVGAVASWQLIPAIAVSKQDDDAMDVVVVCLMAVLATVAVLTATLWLVGERLAVALGGAELVQVFWLVPPGVLCFATARVLTSWAARRQQYPRIGLTKAVEGSLKGSGQVALADVGSGMVAADVLARAAGTLLLLWPVRAALQRGLHTMSAQRLWATLQRFREFPLFAAPALLLNCVGQHAALLLLTTFHGFEVAGLYILGQRVIGMPTALIGQAASHVFLGDGGQLARHDPIALRRLFAITTRRLLALGVVPIGALAITAPWLFGWVFGPQWVEAGHYARALSLTYGLQFVALPLSQTLGMLERQRWQLAWDAARLLLVAGSLIVLGLNDAPPRTMVAALAVTTGIAYAALHGLGWLAVCRHAKLAAPPVGPTQGDSAA